MRALVISGGGGKFWYGAGALHTLKEQGHQFDLVYGTSTGSICTLLWMQGNPKRAWDIAEDITPDDLYHEGYGVSKLTRFARGKPLADNAPMIHTLRKYFPRHTLDFSFRSHVVATNIIKQRRKVFEIKANDPDIYRYVVASTAIPALFRPVHFNDELVCIDGAAIDNNLLSPPIAEGATEIVLIALAEKRVMKVDPDNLFEVINAVTDGTLNRQLRRDLALTEARNHLSGFKKIKVQLIRPKKSVPVGLFQWNVEQAREAFDMGSVDALNMETIIEPDSEYAKAEGGKL